MNMDPQASELFEPDERNRVNRTTPNRERNVFVVSLGCAKNLVDSEHMLGLLEAAGYRPVDSLDLAGTVIVNTCGFIQPAVEEAIETILEMVEMKATGRLNRVFAVGCFVQRYGYKLRRGIPEVDGWAGTGEIHRIAELLAAPPGGFPPFLIGRPRFARGSGTPRLVSGAGFSTYLKIADGCSHRCAFCMIPSLRGPLRSRSVGSLVEEAGVLAGQGAVELNLVAQDTTAYGADRRGGPRIEDLLEALLEVEELQWIRVLYAHPSGIGDRLLTLMESEERICPYLDLPLQHVNPGVLRAMDRSGEGGETPWELLARIRSRARRIHVRTTLMTGFPGETEDAFEELCDFVAGADLDHMGAFVFSPEAGIPASRFPDPVPREESERRRDRLMRIQAGVSLRRKREVVGRVEPVLVEGTCPETELLLVGRTAGMAPEVDGRVLINRGCASAGRIVPVRMTEAHPYDLVGEVVERDPDH
ncbi:MAG: 30S ribosomal protein S12 methylthiotransferase RimO [Deltaproteobacteria bacterium]|nr:30S ribosomal protein S12 methylthiotransferase RimO [Deltaproteobacteria bacterium]